MNDRKLCTFCGEEIKSIAIKCRYCGSMLSDAPSPSGSLTGIDLVRQALGDRYEVLEEIGSGGMATVYKAIQKSLGRMVALKVIHQNLVHDEQFVKRFHREARVCASLQHPNIVTVHDEGEVSGVYFIAMQYLEGSTLQAIIDQKKSLSLQETWEYLLPIAQALDHAHARGIIHRDVKSSNILITRDNRPVLLDFGIARSNDSTNLTKTGAVLGTPDYLSPEQVEGKPVDHRTDVYSLGVVYYQCLTGRLPFKSDKMHTTLYKIVHQEPESPSELNPEVFASCKSLDADFERIVQYKPKFGIEWLIVKSLNKNPNDRFLTVIQFIDALHYRLSKLKNIQLDNKRLSGRNYQNSAEMRGLTLLRNALSGKFVVHEFISANIRFFDDGHDYLARSPVIRAYDFNDERFVVLKLRDAHMVNIPEFYDILLDEAAKWQKLNHPNIIKIYEEASLGGIYYLAREYLQGKSLREYIIEKGPLGVNETIRILIPALNAVKFIHSQGVQHRKILAKNIFITSEGRIVILDYGISHAFATQNLRSLSDSLLEDTIELPDICGFGLVMIQCLTGLDWSRHTRHIYPGLPIDMPILPEDYFKDFVKQFNSPQWLKEIIFKAIFRKDKSSYTSIAEMIHDLEQVLNHL